MQGSDGAQHFMSDPVMTVAEHRPRQPSRLMPGLLITPRLREVAARLLSERFGIAVDAGARVEKSASARSSA